MLAPAVAAGKGVKGEKECRHCLRIDAIIVARRPAFGGTPRIASVRPAPRGSLPAGKIFSIRKGESIYSFACPTLPCAQNKKHSLEILIP